MEQFRYLQLNLTTKEIQKDVPEKMETVNAKEPYSMELIKEMELLTNPRLGVKDPPKKTGTLLVQIASWEVILYQVLVKLASAHQKTTKRTNLSFLMPKNQIHFIN